MKLTIALSLIILSFSSFNTMADEQINLNQLIKNQTVLTIEGENLKIEDKRICAAGYYTEDQVGQMSMEQAEAVCSFLGQNLPKKLKLRASLAEYQILKVPAFHSAESCILFNNGSMSHEASTYVLSKVKCIQDNR